MFALSINHFGGNSALWGLTTKRKSGISGKGGLGGLPSRPITAALPPGAEPRSWRDYLLATNKNVASPCLAGRRYPPPVDWLQVSMVGIPSSMAHTPTPPATPPIPNLVHRYLNGESIQSLARQHNVCRQSIYNWLHSEVSDQHYPDLVRQGLIAHLAHAESLLMEARTSVDVARAREVLNLSKWQLERRVKMFSPKQESVVDSSLTIIVQRRGETPRDIPVSHAEILEEHKKINGL